MTEAGERREVWITGVGLISSLGTDAAVHKTHFETGQGRVVDETRYAPYPVHPLVSLDWSKQIPKNSDQRQMETWQRIGVYAAGLALADAGIAGKPELLDRTALLALEDDFEGSNWLTKMTSDIWTGEHDDFADLYGQLARFLFDIGFLGCALPKTKPIYSQDEPGYLERRHRLTTCQRFLIHPAFRRALDCKLDEPKRGIDPG